LCDGKEDELLARGFFIFAIAVTAGLCLSAMARGAWPAVGKEAPLPVIGRVGRGVSEEALRLAGLAPAAGPGVRITLDDAPSMKKAELTPERLYVHARDLLMLRNELFAAGAEAVSINGLRMAANSAIRCVGPVILINNTPVAPPYVIEAAGDPDVLKPAMLMMGGLVDALSRENLRVNLTREKNLKIPVYETGKNTLERKNGGAK
jgi:uncharacterized protein YlxW (UPF0749 family)